MPLIEAFLAFALTMLAFATAVSAVVGVWLRALRWRAAGLRRSLEAVYDRELEPASRVAGVESNWEDRLEFIADMTFSIDSKPGRLAEDARRQRLHELRKAYSIEAPAVHESGRADVASGRARSAGAVPVLSRLAAPLHRWRSLRFGMDYIPESQFRLRLERSDAWRKLAAVLDRRRLAEYEDYLTRYFTEIGLVATEEFARRSRVRTVIAGLLLAVLVNADAFDLLNAYMTDEALRREIVARQDEILGEADFGPADVEGSSRRAEMLGSRADSALARAQSQVAAIAASPLLDQSGRDAVLGLAESLAAVRTDVQAATEAGREVESAVSATRSIAAGLTKAFPIGWDGYPNCKPGTADLRCVRLIERMPTGIDHDTSLVTVSRAVAMVDTAAFAKWLVGILLTGFMAGLGAPFWMQTVDRVLKLKDHAQRARANELAQQAARPAPVSPAASDASGGSVSAAMGAGSLVTPGTPSAPGKTARRAADEVIERRRSDDDRRR